MQFEKQRSIELGRPGEDIGRKELVAIVRRFQNLHRLQIQRIQECQARRQRIFLDALPLLFHSNHPGLPGFVSTETPAGIPGYHPSRRTLDAVGQLSRAFTYSKRSLPVYPILALYLMGSVGSVAYSRRSDLDIWLCHGHNLEPEELDELRRKAALVERWAGSLELEAHIFLIDADRFRMGEGAPISTESCGSVQHHLLLEEFYRTSLWLAGRIPAWWLVPPDQEGRYAEYLRHLLDKRFVDAIDVVDFGGLEPVGSDEFLGGTLWHLHKAIAAPYKSLLKLFLMESYAAEFPDTGWLCTRLKAAVFRGDFSLREFDPYLLMYGKVEQYLSGRCEFERLELARQSFYLKINELLGVATASASEKRLRREALDAMIEAWGWPPERVRDMEARRHWNIGKAIEEQQSISRELTLSYQGVRRFALEHAGTDGAAGSEIKLLGRRLAAALERKPGKVDKLHLDSSDRIEMEDLFLGEIQLGDGDRGWALSVSRPGAGDGPPGQVLKKARSLLEILAWLVLNGLYRKSLGLFMDRVDSTPTTAELRSALDALAGFMAPLPADSETLAVYARPARIVAAALFFNLGLDADAHRRDGLRLASSRYDALSYGHARTNLVRQVDVLTVTSWGEMLVQRHEGLAGLFDCLSELLQGHTDALRFECQCFAGGRARTIVKRVTDLYRDLGAALPLEREHARFLVRGGASLFLFERQYAGLRYRELAGEAELYAELAGLRPAFSPLAFDRNAAPDLGPLPLIFDGHKAGVIQVYCLVEPGQVRVFVLDERGSLFYRVHEPIMPAWVLGPYASLLGMVLQRYVLAAGGVEYFQLERSASGYAARPADFRPEPARRVLNIRVFAEEVVGRRAAYAIFCNEREFSSIDAGQEVFAEAAEHILRLRQSGERYPIYITDIDVPLSILGVDTPEQLQTIHFLHYKRKIEQRLNG